MIRPYNLKESPDHLNIIKGLTIVFFMVNHFRIICWSVNLDHEGYGRAAVGLFFLASGYVTQLSLRRRLNQTGPQGWIRLRFWWDRAARVYPLHLLAVALIPVFFGTPVKWWQMLGVDTPFWFFSHILQCYLAAPGLYCLAKSRSRAIQVSPIIIYGVINVFALSMGLDLHAQPWLKQFSYQHLALTHVLLAYLGMLTAEGRLAWPRKAAIAGGPGLFAGYALVMVGSGVNYTPWLNGVLAVVYLLASAIFFASFRAVTGNIPGRVWLAFLGRYSWPICLFEPVYYFVLFKFRLLQVHSWHDILVFVVFSPLFMGACVFLQEAQNLVFGRASWSLRGMRLRQPE